MHTTTHIWLRGREAEGERGAKQDKKVGKDKISSQKKRESHTHTHTHKQKEWQ